MAFSSSALAKSEEAAIATLPLLIVPQLLLSAVATGQVDSSYARRDSFQPFVIAVDWSAEPQRPPTVTSKIVVPCRCSAILDRQRETS